MALKIRYNAPLILTFSLFCAVVLLLDLYLGTELRSNYFAVPGKSGFSWGDRGQYYQLFSHIIGHKDWNHMTSNFTFILLLGPILEERFGSFRLTMMILVTALATGIINVSYYESALMGASGIVFMMIILISIVNIRRNEIPLTLILMTILYLAREVLNLFAPDSVSQIAHISGGISGMILGFIVPPRVQRGKGQKGKNSQEKRTSKTF